MNIQSRFHSCLKRGREFRSFGMANAEKKLLFLVLLFVFLLQVLFLLFLILDQKYSIISNVNIICCISIRKG